MHHEGNFESCKGFFPVITFIWLFTVTVYPLIAMHFLSIFKCVVNAFRESVIRKHKGTHQQQVQTLKLSHLRRFQTSWLSLTRLHCERAATGRDVNEANAVRIIKCDVVHFGLDVWVYEFAVRQAEGSGSCSSVVFTSAVFVCWRDRKFTCYPNESFHVKVATVNRLWIWMIIFKIIFTNVLLFRHVWVSKWVSVLREVDCILYGMFNV